MEITNYTFDEFLTVEADEADRISELLQWLEPIEDFEFDGKFIEIKHLETLTFGQVDEVRYYLNNPTPDGLCKIINLVTEIETDKVFQLAIIDLYSALNTVKAQEKILGIREGELSDEPDADWELVGGSEKMAKYGVMGIIDSLADGDVTKWKSIENLPYYTIYTKLKMNKDMAIIQRAIASLQKQRQRNQ